MATYTLKVSVDKTQFPTLKESGYKLCLAKKVNGAYTVVWSGEDFLQHNTFEWTEAYQLFGVNQFKVGALVESSTDNQDVKYGQTCLMDKDGTLNSATGAPDQSGTFHFSNQYGAIHVGVNGSLNGKFLPIFVSPTIVSGVADLSPIVTVQVWFDLNVKTSTMIFKSVADSVEVAYEGSIAKAVGYGGDKPGLGSWSVLPDPTS